VLEDTALYSYHSDVRFAEWYIQGRIKLSNTYGELDMQPDNRKPDEQYPEERKRNTTRIIIIIVVVLALLFICWQFILPAILGPAIENVFQNISEGLSN